MSWCIVRDNLKDLRLHRLINGGEWYELLRPEKSSCAGVAWLNKTTQLYNVYDIKAGGGAVAENLNEPEAVMALWNLVR